MEIKEAIEILQCIIELKQTARQDMRAEILAIHALEEKAERDNMRCENCAHESHSPGKYPCNQCANCYINQFEERE